MLEIFITILVVSFLFYMGYSGYTSERKDWNNGISPIGENWRYFDTDSHGGRGYTDSEDNTIWISYPGIDKFK